MTGLLIFLGLGFVFSWKVAGWFLLIVGLLSWLVDIVEGKK